MKTVKGLCICASCEWVFRVPEPAADRDPDVDDATSCPVCGFAYYRATTVYTRHQALRAEKTQEFWKEKKHNVLERILDSFISEGRFDGNLPSGRLPPSTLVPYGR